MHTWSEGSLRIHHNSDLSGDVVLFNTETKQEMTVPGKALVDFICDTHVRGKFETITDNLIEHLKEKTHE